MVASLNPFKFSNTKLGRLKLVFELLAAISAVTIGMVSLWHQLNPPGTNDPNSVSYKDWVIARQTERLSAQEEDLFKLRQQIATLTYTHSDPDSSPLPIRQSQLRLGNLTTARLSSTPSIPVKSSARDSSMPIAMAPAPIETSSAAPMPAPLAEPLKTVGWTFAGKRADDNTILSVITLSKIEVGQPIELNNDIAIRSDPPSGLFLSAPEPSSFVAAGNKFTVTEIRDVGLSGDVWIKVAN